MKKKDLRREIIKALEGKKRKLPVICKDCSKKMHISTQNFGGKFICQICRRLETGVPSSGHGVACRRCQEKGYCKFCGKIC